MRALLLAFVRVQQPRQVAEGRLGLARRGAAAGIDLQRTVVVSLLQAQNSPDVRALLRTQPRSLIAAAIAAVGAVAGVLMASTPEGDVLLLYSGRALSGVAVGVLSVSIPLYQSEIAPVHLRGRRS